MGQKQQKRTECGRVFSRFCWLVVVLRVKPCIKLMGLEPSWCWGFVNWCFIGGDRPTRSKSTHDPKRESRWWFQLFFIFTATWAKIPTLTNIFQMGWNHQVGIYFYHPLPFFYSQLLLDWERVLHTTRHMLGADSLHSEKHRQKNHMPWNSWRCFLYMFSPW